MGDQPSADLSLSELLVGGVVGVYRRATSIAADAAQTVPGLEVGGEGWMHDIESTLAELAFAKITNRYWDASIGRFRGSKKGDVGPIQVRSTVHDHGHLILRDHDKDTDVFVLIIGCAPHYRLAGWILGRDGKKDEYRSDPGDRGRPCWLIPQKALRA